MISLVRAVCAGLVLSGCLPTSPSAEDDFRRNRERWDARQPARYEFFLERGACECPAEWTTPLKVEVHDRQIRSVTNLLDGREVSATEHRAPSIDDLFDQIQSALDRGAHSVEVTYDPRLGHPTSVLIDEDPQMVDDQLSLTIRALRALN